ncbi:MAG TPA: DivIVA domain-containing protein [Acidimicrobiales bacterium]|nr:DivIVA domain-containing protein [Acidimicrobiales bacterium]
MASELTPQGIRDVRFREKLRGYHPEDVDAFVARVAATVETLQQRLAETAGGTPAGEGTPTETDIEESLRRTLVLAQRTADMAVQEAREEAARLVGEAEGQRAEVLAEVEELRTRTKAELENELSGYRQRLHDERDALQRDVAALHAYVAHERERLRVYFSEQLAQVEAGVPGVADAPPQEGPARADDEPASTAVAAAVEPAADPEPAKDAAGDRAEPEAGEAGEDDPYLAELRRAVDDDAPLGPRDDDVDLPEKDSRDLDIFNDDDGGGRFLRRRR